jgi:hypothetical protein
MSALFRPIALLTAVTGLLVAGSARAVVPAKLIVQDNAKMFSPEAIDKAKKLVSENKGQVEREVHLETYEKLSAADQKRFDAVKGDKTKVGEFWRDWTKGKASGERGLVIAINRHPGHVSVITSDTMGKFFTREDREARGWFLSPRRKPSRRRTTPSTP